MPTPPRATRRAALAGTIGTALGSVVLGGCDTDDLRPHDDARPTVTRSAPAGRNTPDETLVDQVSTAISGAVLVVRRARALPTLRPGLGSLLRTHRAHLAALDATPGTASASPDPATAAEALTGLRTVEQALQRQLVEASGRAQSGTLAALLASMSASIAQHLAVLAAEPAA